ncbi:DUF7210 family protein [Exercitatus varius]|uniref:DUF7210 family protein n=1 Tax=Exercitatus varius TaxID=67857 RepID=UPI00294AB0C2|nr:hypothetical protein [Exercitatus varius]MDG2958873.1 hypothetical protein [Exercitatus varius]
MAKVTATVKGSPLLHNGKRYDIGATIELDEAQAENLGIYLDIVKPAEDGNKQTGNKQTGNKQTGNKQTDGAKKTQQKDAGKGDESKVE